MLCMEHPGHLFTSPDQCRVRSEVVHQQLSRHQAYPITRTIDLSVGQKKAILLDYYQHTPKSLPNNQHESLILIREDNHREGN
jgi:hypothetical protein